jgi:hypothetical protein
MRPARRRPGIPAAPHPARTVILVLLLVALVPALPGAWAAFEQHRRITTWRPVPAVVVRSEASTRYARGGPETRALVRYRYETAGGVHEADTLLPGPWGSTFAATEEILAAYPAGARTTAWHHPGDPARAFLLPEHSFLPYLAVLLASFVVALAAGLATGGVRFVRSSEREVPAPVQARGDWWEVEAFRPFLRLRDSALAALGVFGVAGLAVFGHYLAVEPAPGALGILALLGWGLLLLRLSWGALARTRVARSLGEARVFVRPPEPVAGGTLEVRVEQPVRRGLRVRRLEATLVCERTVLKITRSRTRARTTTAYRERVVLLAGVRVQPPAPLRGTHTFAVPPGVVHDGGFLRWRVEVRTRLLGFDYRSRFPLAGPDEEESA